MTSKDRTKTENRFLVWATKNTRLFSEPSFLKYEISGKTIFSARIKAVSTKLNEQYTCMGYSDSLREALIKAYMEGIERVTSFEIMTERSLPVIPSVQNSNGWASHFDPFSSKKNAMNESLERHTLLYNFLKNSWSGFYRAGSGRWKNFEYETLISYENIPNHCSGMILVKLPTMKGFTCGYFIYHKNDEHEHIENRKNHAILEALTPALALEGHFLKYKKMAESGDLIARYRIHYANQPYPVIPEKDSARIREIKNIHPHSLTLDVSQRVNAPIPLYSSFSYGDDLIPLCFSQKSKKITRIAANRIAENHNLNIAWPEWHPIL